MHMRSIPLHPSPTLFFSTRSGGDTWSPGGSEGHSGGEWSETQSRSCGPHLLLQAEEEVPRSVCGAGIAVQVLLMYC